MSEHDAILGEKYSHKVSAEFDSQSAADKAVQSLVNKVGLSFAQIRVIQPYDADMGRKIEPDGKGIARSLVRTHVTLGLAGLVVGLVIAAVLTVFGPAVTRTSPVMTFIAFGFLCPILGLLLAGAISLRPDHDPLIEKTRTATDEGRWTVMAHCTDHDEQERVKAAIGYSSQTL